MYRVAQRLTPDSYHTLARAVFAEMALAGVTVVGEFHYLHHGPGGTRYADPNAMAQALVAAAEEANAEVETDGMPQQAAAASAIKEKVKEAAEVVKEAVLNEDEPTDSHDEL